MKTIALIPARKGSKGFPDKNMAEIQGRSLIEMAVRVGRDCPQIQQVFISTDSPAYEAAACRAGAISLGLRSPELSNDTARTCDVAIDFLKQLDDIPDILVLLQPTSPVRTPRDISQVISRFNDPDVQAVVSVEKLIEPHPFKLKKLTSQGYLEPFIPHTSSETPRQELPDLFKLNGAIYAIRSQTLITQGTFLPQNTLPYLMKGSVNIDDERDYQVLKTLFNNNEISLYGV